MKPNPCRLAVDRSVQISESTRLEPLGQMASTDTVRRLQQYLVQVKLEAAEREAAQFERYKVLEAECSRLRQEYELAREELSLCWAFVDHLKKENTLKWRCEERDDW